MKIAAATPQSIRSPQQVRAQSPVSSSSVAQTPSESFESRDMGRPLCVVDKRELAGANPVSQAQLFDQASTAVDAASGLVGAGLGAAVQESFKSGFVKGYLSPTQIYDRCKQLAQEYPDLVELVERPYRTHGYDGKEKSLQGSAPLYYLRLGPKDQDRDAKLGVFQFAAPHAREWLNPMIMMEMTEQLLANYNPNSSDPQVRANTELLQKLDVYVAPMTNPDGTNFSIHDDRMWRKTRVPTEKGNFGVDINRNFATGWTAGDPSEITYPGKGPLSEVETQNIVGVLDDHANIRFVCDWHSYSEEIRRPWGVSEKDLPTYVDMHRRMDEALSSVRDRHYGQVISEVVDGTSDDYFYHERKVFSSLVETGRSFQPKPDEAMLVMREGVAAARELLSFAQDHAEKHGMVGAQPPDQIPPFRETQV